MSTKPLTVADINAAVAMLEANNIGPLRCDACQRRYYVAGLGVALCECGGELLGSRGALGDSVAKASAELSRVWARATDAWIAAWILRLGTVPALCTNADMVAWLEPSAESLPDISDRLLRDLAEKLPVDVAAHPERFQMTVGTNGTTEGGIMIGVAWEPLNSRHLSGTERT